MLPGVNIQVSGSAAAATIPTDTGQCFAVMVTQRGSSTSPTLLQRMADYTTYAGQRQTSSVAYDWADGYFGEGGKKLWCVRAVAATATQATLNLMDASTTASLVYKAGLLGDPDPGTWANGATGGLSVQVTSPGAGQFQILTYLAGQLVETSPPFSSQLDAIAWFANYSKYGVLTLGASSQIPAVAPATSLAGGTDGTVQPSDYQAALNNIPSELGPGQIVIPGAATSALQLMAIASAGVGNVNRFALIDPTDTPSASALVGQAQALYAAPNNGRRFAQFAAPYDVIPGLTELSTRQIPPSARLAAEYARVDALGNSNQSAMGAYGRAQYALDLTQPNWSDSDRLALNNAGVTISRRRPGGVIATYGLRTLADQNYDANWSMAPNVRAVMWYCAQAKNVAEAYVGAQIDGNGNALGDLKGALSGPAMDMYTAGALFSTDGKPSSSYSIDTSPAVNPPTQLETGEVVANVKLKVSPNAEAVQINIVKVPLDQSV